MVFDTGVLSIQRLNPTQLLNAASFELIGSSAICALMECQSISGYPPPPSLHLTFYVALLQFSGWGRLVFTSLAQQHNTMTPLGIKTQTL